MFTRTVRPTGEKLTVATAAEFGVDATDGKWITFCEDHKTIANSATQKLAYDARGADFCEECRERQAANPTNAKVNLNDQKQALAYQEGMRDGLALLITMLEEGGINGLLEGVAGNARPADVARLDAYYAAGNGKRR